MSNQSNQAKIKIKQTLSSTFVSSQYHLSWNINTTCRLLVTVPSMCMPLSISKPPVFLFSSFPIVPWIYHSACSDAMNAGMATASHLLAPTSLALTLQQCVQQHDLAYAKFKVAGALEALHVHLSDSKYVALMTLLQEIAPTPAPAPTTATPSAAHTTAPEPSTSAILPGSRAPTSAGTNALLAAKRSARQAQREAERQRKAFAAAAAAMPGTPASIRKRTGSSVSRTRSEAEDEFFSCDEGEDSDTETPPSSLRPGSAAGPAAAPVDEEAQALAAARHEQAVVQFAIVDIRVFLEEDADGPTARALPAAERSAAHVSPTAPARALLTLCVRHFEVERLVLRDDVHAELRLSALEVLDNVVPREPGADQRYLVQSNPSTPLPCFEYAPSSDCLIQVSFHSCPETSPLFAEEHNATKTRANISLGDLRVTARQETLRRVLGWSAATLAAAAAATDAQLQDDPVALEAHRAAQAAVAVQAKMARETAASTAAGSSSEGGSGDDVTRSRAAPVAGHTAAQSSGTSTTTSRNVVNMQAQAHLGSLQLVLETQHGCLASALLAGAEAEATVTDTLTTATAALRSLCLADATHPAQRYQQVLTVTGDEVFRAKVLLHNRPPATPRAPPAPVPDLEADVAINQLQFVYLARFVTDLGSFAAGMAPPPLPAATTRTTTTARSSSPVPSTFSQLSSTANQLQATADSVNAATGKMGLRISLAAPRILVPLATDSATCAVLELGHVQIGNRLALEAPPGAGNLRRPGRSAPQPLLLDYTQLALTNLCLFFTELPASGGFDIGAADRTERAIIRPVSVELNVTRCLQAQRHEVPAVAVVIAIPEIALHLNDADFSAALAVLAGNLAETPSLPVPPKPASAAATGTAEDQAGGGDAHPTQPSHVPDLDVNALELAAITEEDVEEPETRGGGNSGDGGVLDTLNTAAATDMAGAASSNATDTAADNATTGRARSVTVAVREAMREQTQDEVWANFSATFSLAHVSVELCKARAPLARLDLRDFSTAATLSNDGSTVARVTLGSLAVLDAREDSPSVYRCLLGTRIMPEAAAACGLPLPVSDGRNTSDYRLVVLRYTALEGTQSVSLTFDGLRVAVCMEFILALTAFLSSAAAQAATATATESESDTENDTDGSGSTEAAAPPTTAGTAATSPAAPASDEGSLRVQVAISDPVIALVADHTQLDSRALRLTLSLQLFYAASSLQQNASVALDGLRLGSLRPHAGVRRYVAILEPLGISLAYSRDMETKIMSINATVGHLRLSVGYNDLQVVQSVLTALATTGETDTDTPIPAVTTVDLSARPVADVKWYMRKVDDDAVSLVSAATSADPRRHATGRWTPVHLLRDAAVVDAAAWLQSSTAQLDLEAMDLTLIDDYQKQDCPLLLVSATLSANARNLTSRTEPLQAWATLGLAVAYYNAAVSAWEPLLEPLVDRKTQGATPWELSGHVWVNPSGESDGEEGVRGSNRSNGNGSGTIDPAADSLLRRSSSVSPDAQQQSTNGDDELTELNAADDTLEPEGQLPHVSCILSGERMELTVSNALYRTIMDCVFVAGEAKQVERAARAYALGSRSGNVLDVLDALPAADAVAAGEERHFAAFRLRNITGHDLEYSLEAQFGAHGTRGHVAEGASVPLDFALEEDVTRPMRALTIHHAAPHRRLSFLIAGCRPVENVAVDVVGEYAKPLQLLSGDGKQRLWICIEVALVGATKVITVRSTFQIQNELEIPLDVAYTSRQGELVELADVSPGERYSLPLTVAYHGFHVRPAGLAYDYCKEALSWHISERQFAHCLPYSAAGWKGEGDGDGDLGGDVRSLTTPASTSAVSGNGNDTTASDATASETVTSDTDKAATVAVRPPAAATAAAAATTQSAASHDDDVIDLSVPQSPLVAGPSSGASETTLQLQASNAKVRYDRGRPGKLHPENVLTFSAPLTLRNALPLELELQLSSSDPSLPDTTMTIAAGQSLPIFGGVRRKISAKLRCGGVDAAWTALVTLFKPNVPQVRARTEWHERKRKEERERQSRKMGCEATAPGRFTS